MTSTIADFTGFSQNNKNLEVFCKERLSISLLICTRLPAWIALYSTEIMIMEQLIIPDFKSQLQRVSLR